EGAPTTATAPPAHYHDRDDHAAAPARPEGRALHAVGGTQTARVGSDVGAGLQARPSHGPSTEETIRERSSPLVRKIAKEHNVDISQINGTGIAGRVTKDDILGFLAGQEGSRAGRQDGKAERPEGRAPAGSPAPVPAAPQF